MSNKRKEDASRAHGLKLADAYIAFRPLTSFPQRLHSAIKGTTPQRYASTNLSPEDPLSSATAATSATPLPPQPQGLSVTDLCMTLPADNQRRSPLSRPQSAPQPCRPSMFKTTIRPRSARSKIATERVEATVKSLLPSNSPPTTDLIDAGMASEVQPVSAAAITPIPTQNNAEPNPPSQRPASPKLVRPNSAGSDGKSRRALLIELATLHPVQILRDPEHSVDDFLQACRRWPSNRMSALLRELGTEYRRLLDTHTEVNKELIDLKIHQQQQQQQRKESLPGVPEAADVPLSSRDGAKIPPPLEDVTDEVPIEDVITEKINSAQNRLHCQHIGVFILHQESGMTFDVLQPDTRLPYANTILTRIVTPSGYPVPYQQQSLTPLPAEEIGLLGKDVRAVNSVLLIPILAPSVGTAEALNAPPPAPRALVAALNKPGGFFASDRIVLQNMAEALSQPLYDNPIIHGLTPPSPPAPLPPQHPILAQEHFIPTTSSQHGPEPDTPKSGTKPRALSTTELLSGSMVRTDSIIVATSESPPHSPPLTPKRSTAINLARSVRQRLGPSTSQAIAASLLSLHTNTLLRRYYYKWMDFRRRQIRRQWAIQTCEQMRRSSEMWLLETYYNKMKYQTAANSAHRRKQQVDTLLGVAAALSSEIRNTSTLITIIMAKARELTQADRSTLFLLDKEKNELWSKIAEGIPEIRVKVGLGIAGTVAKTGETINIPDAYKDARFNPAIDKKSGYKTNHILCMPLINQKKEVIGVTQLINKLHAPCFSNYDVQILAAFCSQAAVAIENSLLFEEAIETKNLFMSVLHSISYLVITLNSDGLLLTTNRDPTPYFAKSEKDLKVIHYSKWLGTGSETNDGFIRAIQQVYLKQNAASQTDYVLQLEDGRSKTVNFTVNPLFDAKGEHKGVVIILEDVTQEKKMMSTLSRYMSPVLVEQVLADGGQKLGGTHQHVSVLFVDICKFTTLSENMTPHGVVEMLNVFFQHVGNAIFEENGILDKYIGDCCMAVFGLPFAKPDDAQRACQTAIKIVQYISKHMKMEPQLHLGIGINTGDALAGNIGCAKRMEYTVIGDNVNLASRIEGATRMYGVQALCSEFTHKECAETIRMREVDRIRVKGKQKGVVLYEILQPMADPVSPELQNVLDHYSTGLGLYRQAKFTEAMVEFKAIPNDPPAQTMLGRCEHYLIEPPEPGWDGTWTAHSK